MIETVLFCVAIYVLGLVWMLRQAGKPKDDMPWIIMAVFWPVAIPLFAIGIMILFLLMLFEKKNESS